MPLVAEMDIKSSGSGYERDLQFIETCTETKENEAICVPRDYLISHALTYASFIVIAK